MRGMREIGGSVDGTLQKCRRYAAWGIETYKHGLAPVPIKVSPLCGLGSAVWAASRIQGCGAFDWSSHTYGMRFVYGI